jgi:phosphoserine aminotransferase
MSFINKPGVYPKNPNFLSGPCTKRSNWDVNILHQALVGRSHRSKQGKAKINQAIELTRKILQIPQDYRIGIMTGSNTGAFEAALWSVLGERGVDVFAWESFGFGWLTDVTKQLKLEDVRAFKEDYGKIPDLTQADCERDIVFVWNGTTSGVRVANADWIRDDRSGLTICDATSGAFAYELPWEKLDITTLSWQKVMGSEAGHGMIILSTRAVARLESYIPPWPLPKIFRMTKNGKLDEKMFVDSPINTPSMLCVEDYIDTLKWAESIGGLTGLIWKVKDNFTALADWVEGMDWIDFLAEDEAFRSYTSVCLKITASWFLALTEDKQAQVVKAITALLDQEGVAYDIGAYRDAPPGFRVWCGATVETKDIRALTSWLNWAYQQVGRA